MLLRYLVLATVLCVVSCLYPVLLVPGDISSQLQARYVKSPPHIICGLENKWFTVWLNPIYFIQVNTLMDCMVQTMRLNYDPKSHTTFSPDFCEVRVPGFGTVDTISYLSWIKICPLAYFAGIIKSLESKYGYTANKDILGAPYDFRKGPKEMGKYLSDVKALIEKMSRDNGDRPVIVIGHSMGNMHMVRLFNEVTQAWKDRFVKVFLSISSPYSGSMKAVQSILSGTEIPLMSPVILQSLFSTWPSSYYLLPSPSIWSKDVIVSTKEGNFTAKDLKKLLRLSKIKYSVERYEDSVIGMPPLRAPNVTMHCIYSTNVPTVTRLDYSSITFPTDQPKEVYGDGDGSVNIESLRQCAAWRSQQYYPIKEHIIQNVKHFKILNNRKAIAIINDIIATIL